MKQHSSQQNGSLTRYAIVQFLIVFVPVGIVASAILVPLAAREGSALTALRDVSGFTAIGGLMYSLLMTFVRWYSGRRDYQGGDSK